MIGTSLKEARRAAGLTQKQVAKTLYISEDTVRRWENGKTYPRLLEAAKLSKEYGISMEDITDCAVESWSRSFKKRTAPPEGQTLNVTDMNGDIIGQIPAGEA